jgi:hypothetical protein
LNDFFLRKHFWVMSKFLERFILLCWVFFYTGSLRDVLHWTVRRDKKGYLDKSQILDWSWKKWTPFIIFIDENRRLKQREKLLKNIQKFWFCANFLKKQNVIYHFGLTNFFDEIWRNQDIEHFGNKTKFLFTSVSSWRI